MSDAVREYSTGWYLLIRKAGCTKFVANLTLLVKMSNLAQFCRFALVFLRYAETYSKGSVVADNQDKGNDNWHIPINQKNKQTNI